MQNLPLCASRISAEGAETSICTMIFGERLGRPHFPGTGGNEKRHAARDLVTYLANLRRELTVTFGQTAAGARTAAAIPMFID
jgi:hypothetical protein